MIGQTRPYSIISLTDHIIPKREYLSLNCEKSIDIPIGLDQQGHEYDVILNSDTAFMLVTGHPGSGKSNLLHTVICQCIARYSGDALELFLIDQYEGLEFGLYERYGIKSIKAILGDSKSNNMFEFLKFLKAGVENRIEQFHSLMAASGKDVCNIEQFYAVNNEGHFSPHIPRMLIIMDNFSQVAHYPVEIESMLNALLLKSQIFGIHLIVASQMVPDWLNSSDNAILSQTVYRGVMSPSLDSVQDVILPQHLGMEDSAPPEVRFLKSGQLIMNKNRGDEREDSTLVQCYYTNDETASAICAQIVQRQ